MIDAELRKVCERFGITLEELRRNIRTTKNKEGKTNVVIFLRDEFQLTYTEIADVCNYYDRSGAKQVYDYGKRLIRKKKNDNG